MQKLWYWFLSLFGITPVDTPTTTTTTTTPEQSPYVMGTEGVVITKDPATTAADDAAIAKAVEAAHGPTGTNGPSV
jgi:hypothetical protein